MATYPTRRTFQQLYLDVDTHAYGTGTTASPWVVQGLVQKAVNEAQEELWLRILLTNVDIFRQVTFIDLVAGQNEYSLPLNFHRVKVLEYLPPGGTVYVPIRHADETDPRKTPHYTTNVNRRSQFLTYDIMQTKVGAGDPSGQPAGVTINTLVLDNVPAQSVTQGLRLTYIYKPDPMALDGDFINMDMEWENPLFNLAVGNFLSTYLGDNARAQAYMNKANYQIQTRLASIITRDTDQGEYMTTGRQN